ncbi:hypothetical protein GCM10009851_21800 [Herbiconiux moechotypicola]|uniref:Uncharacterized protein n=1 Tax=Herbiconiux moechotypicola TaxID=637393 RepID=A0ABN3DMP4_9MICO
MATLLLILDMVRRVRRVNLRAQVRAELAEEVAAKEAAGQGQDAEAGTSTGAASDSGERPASPRD